MSSEVVRYFKQKKMVLFSLLMLIIVTVPMGVLIGGSDLSLIDPLSALFNLGKRSAGYTVAWIRLRRVLVGLIVGGLLGGAGVLAQTVYRNPLASPFTLGISHAAALGVAIALITGYAGNTYNWFLVVSRPFILPLLAFSFAMIQSIIVLLLAFRAGLSPQALVLSSISLSFLYQAILALIQYFVLNELQVATITFWMFGNTSRPGDVELYVLLAGGIVIYSIYMILHLDLDVLQLGDDVAFSSGVNPRRAKLLAITMSALGASLATCFVGILAFACLVAPHLARGLVGNSHRYLVPASIMTGALLVEISDIVSRTILYPISLPVGIVLSVIGAPILVLLLVRGGSSGIHRGS